MRIAVSADWHLDAVTQGVSRLSDLTKALNAFMRTMIETPPDVFIFCGDLCNPDKGARTLRAITTASFYARALADCGVDTFWVAGNHDTVDSTEVLTTLSPLQGIDRATVVNELTSIRYGKRWQFIFLPYISKLLQQELAYEDFTSQECALASNEGRRILIAGHCTHVSGATDGTESTLMPRGRTIAFPSAIGAKHGALMVNGHFHTQQRTPYGVHIPGGLARFDFGEARNEPAFYTFETEVPNGA